MRYRKEYGKSREDICLFCDKNATTENTQGLPCCKDHTGSILPDRTCVCGEYLDIKKGKFGAFFLCSQCGPVSIRKSMGMDEEGFKLNKKFRKEKSTNPESPDNKPSPPAPEKVYTLDELRKMW